MTTDAFDDMDPDMNAAIDAREESEASWLRWLSSEGEHE